VIGDSPIVAGFVLVFLVAFLASKGLRRKDPRRCPQCQALGIELLGAKTGDGTREVECRRCATPLVRDLAGKLHHRDAWLAKHAKDPSNTKDAKTNKLGLHG